MDKALSKLAPFLLNSHLKSYIGEVNRAAKTTAGCLIVGAANQTLKFKIKKPVEVIEHVGKKSSHGIIFCRYLMNCSIKEFNDDLASQGVTDVRRHELAMMLVSHPVHSSFFFTLQILQRA